MADELFVIVNNDLQRGLKGSKKFQQESERVFIVSNIKSVDHCVFSIDEDRTVCKTIEMIALNFGNDYELSLPMVVIKIITPFQKELSAIKWELT